jgi:hypothetical protein
MNTRSVRNLLIGLCVAASAVYMLGPWIWLCFGRRAPTYRVTFDVGDGGRTIYFTDWNGAANSIDVDSKEVTELALSSEPVSSIRISRNGESLAVSTEPKDPRRHPEVIVAKRNSAQSWEMHHQFRGKYPCFSRDGESVYYCRSARSLVAGGFSGVLWSDTTLWKFDLATQSEKEISGQVYSVISDIEHDVTRSRLVFSGTPIEPEASFRSHLFELDLKSGKIRQLSECQEDCTCGSEPSLSEDGKILAYISDRDVPYRYKVILENLENQELQVFGPKEINHYSTLPRLFGDECYVLNAESFTMNAQPRFRLIAFDRVGKWREIVGQELLSP